MNVFDELCQRGLIAQMTHEQEIKDLFDKGGITFYIGFDPTADSLHIGHFLQMVVMAHMQRAGHSPIALLGGGTTMVGDPTGKTDMRKMMTQEEIAHNAECFKKQMSRMIDFDKAIMVNNAEWLLELNYINFLREVGVHFSVNRMLTAECFKSRLEKGLSFIEFNYMLMQSYDFLVLSDKYDCKMQFGGDDQWSNIIGGVELVRRSRSKPVYGMTFTLLTTSEGKKMGKTEKGTVWLDPEKTSPYDFYQYWRNIDDKDVLRCMKMLTFIPLEEIATMENWQGSELNEAKRRLACEITEMVHGKEEAEKADATARAVFSQNQSTENMPSYKLDGPGEYQLLELMLEAKIIPSKSEGRRLVEQGGVAVNDEKITDPNAVVKVDGEIVIRKGKKSFTRIYFEG